MLQWDTELSRCGRPGPHGILLGLRKWTFAPLKTQSLDSLAFLRLYFCLEFLIYISSHIHTYAPLHKLLSDGFLSVEGHVGLFSMLPSFVML